MEDRLDIFGYYMAAWGYEYFILMLIVFLFKVLTDFDASLHWYFHLKIKPRPMQLKYNCRIWARKSVLLLNQCSQAAESVNRLDINVIGAMQSSVTQMY